MRIAIIGAGSAGITAAYHLLKEKGITVDLYEKGNNIHDRKRNEVMSGFGGAGTFSDGKLTLTTEYGGWLTDYMSEKELEKLIEEADDIWKNVSGVLELDSKGNYEAIKDLEYTCSRQNLKLYPAKIRHLGTDNCLLFIRKMYEMFEESDTTNLYCNSDVIDLVVEGDKVTGLRVVENGNYRTQI
jgi:uncharacterized FAD-dependent dehydrogenase